LTLKQGPAGPGEENGKRAKGLLATTSNAKEKQKVTVSAGGETTCR